MKEELTKEEECVLEAGFVRVGESGGYVKIPPELSDKLIRINGIDVEKLRRNSIKLSTLCKMAKG
jgi:hypothetical protein